MHLDTIWVRRTASGRHASPLMYHHAASLRNEAIFFRCDIEATMRMHERSNGESDMDSAAIVSRAMVSIGDEDGAAGALVVALVACKGSPK